MSPWALVGRPSEWLININEALDAHGMGGTYWSPCAQMQSQGAGRFQARGSLMSLPTKREKWEKVIVSKALRHSSSGFLESMHVNGFLTHFSHLDQVHPLLRVSPTAGCHSPPIHPSLLGQCVVNSPWASPLPLLGTGCCDLPVLSSRFGQYLTAQGVSAHPTLGRWP